MTEILAMIARIILIVAEGKAAIAATMKMSKEAGIDFKTVWDLLPDRWK
jgi:hypothetical protein